MKKKEKNYLLLKIPSNLEKNIDLIFQDILKIFPDKKSQENLRKIKLNLKNLFHNLLIKQKPRILSHDKLLSPIFLIESSVFINSSYFRLFDLLNGIVNLYVNKNYLSSIILQRQLYETIAYIRWFLDHYFKAINERNISQYIKFSLDVYSEIYVDNKITADHPMVFKKLENIKTAIRWYKKQEKIVFNETVDNDLMDKYYSKLSNILHPNAEGLARFYVSGNIFNKKRQPIGYKFDNNKIPRDVNLYDIFLNIFLMSMEIDIYLSHMKKLISSSKDNFYNYLSNTSNGDVRGFLKKLRTEYIRNKGIYYEKDYFKERSKN